MPVTVLAGPSAVETALVASGLGAERYQFLGYLPRGAAPVRSCVHGEELARWPHAAVAFDSPQRIVDSLVALLPRWGSAGLRFAVSSPSGSRRWFAVRRRTAVACGGQ